jgi:hypothetical protein
LVERQADLETQTLDSPRLYGVIFGTVCYQSQDKPTRGGDDYMLQEVGIKMSKGFTYFIVLLIQFTLVGVITATRLKSKGHRIRRIQVVRRRLALF